MVNNKKRYKLRGMISHHAIFIASRRLAIPQRIATRKGRITWRNRTAVEGTSGGVASKEEEVTSVIDIQDGDETDTVTLVGMGMMRGMV